MARSLSHPDIPPDIDAELSPRARKFFVEKFNAFHKRIAQLEKQVKELMAQVVKLTPRNSSLPPSTQHPHARPVPKPKRRPRTRRKQGAQPGHARHTRPLIPTSQCDDVVRRAPKHCRKCGETLSGTDAQPLRHQVIELPEIRPHVTEYQLQRLVCGCCGTRTCAELPPGVTVSQCGPRLAAFTGLLMGHFRQSKRRAALFLGDVLNIPCSTGWLVKIQNTVSGVLEQPWQKLKDHLPGQKQLFVDESPTKENKAKAWLWVAVATGFAVFGIFLNRKRESLRQLIGKYCGKIINCDRAKMYYDGRLQWCWAHLKRDIQKLVDHPDRKVKRLGHDLMCQERRLFAHWRSYKAGDLTWRAFHKAVGPVIEDFEGLLVRGCGCGNRKAMGMCEELYQRRKWLWTFTRVEGIEPTNNAAERALRPAVILRKLTFGTQSASGSRFVERMLTVTETCRMQNRSPFEYLISAMTAHYHNQPAPSLLPEPGKQHAKPKNKAA